MIQASRRLNDAHGRRRFIRIMAALAAGSAVPAAFAQKFPSRPIRIVVAGPPGALSDILARLIGQKLTDSTGQPAVVENRPGASGLIAAEAVAKSPGDGYTLMLAPDSMMVINPFVFSKLPYDPVKAFQSVALLGKATQILVAAPALRINTLADFVKAAKARPKAINYGSGGIGHPTHMSMELIANRLGLQLTHVPYKGTPPALQGLMGGEVGVAITGVAEGMPQIKAGAIVPLAASGPSAKELFPQLPEFKDAHPDLELFTWFGIFAPASTPRDVLSTLNTEINNALQTPEVRKRLTDFGVVPLPSPIADLDTLIRVDYARYGPLVKALGIVID